MVILYNLIAGLIAAIWNRLVSWLIIAAATGALKSILITAVTLAAITVTVFALMAKVNAYILQTLQGMTYFGPAILGTFASFLPPSLGTCFGIVVSCYLTAIVYNFTKQIVLIKARMAQRAAGFFKA